MSYLENVSVDIDFDPYNRETMEDIINEINMLTMKTELWMEDLIGIIYRIRKLSFFSIHDQKYGILYKHDITKLIFNLFNYTTYIYYDMEDIRYVIHDYDIFKTEKCLCKFNANLNDIEYKKVDRLVFDDTIKEIHIVLLTDSHIDSKDKFYLYDNICYSSINNCDDEIYNDNNRVLKFNNNITSCFDLYGHEFNAYDWNEDMIYYRCKSGLKDIIEKYLLCRIYNLTKNNIDKHISMDLKDISQITSIPNEIYIKHTVLIERNNIPKEYRDITINISNKDLCKNIRNLYDLFEFIHQNNHYDGTRYNREDRRSIITDNGDKYLNTYNWSNNKLIYHNI